MESPGIVDPLTVSSLPRSVDRESLGAELYERARRLFPICRSITGDGLRQTLRVLADEIEIRTEEIPTGTPVFDWQVPKEWNIRDAFIKNTAGDRVIDFGATNLHVMNYSVPVRRKMTLVELRPHLFTSPQHPDWIPYRTSYYKEDWAFCLAHNQLRSLPDGEYDVCIDSSLEEGHLTLGECVLPGRLSDEVLISCHVCHPSLANDNLSGISVGVTLARLLGAVARRYTYRFLFIPATIGAIAWLARHEDVASRIRHGLVLACVGDRGHLSYKRSRRGDAAVDRAVEHVLGHCGDEYAIRDFTPYGYDERQYCSPGLNLPVGLLSRTPHGCFPEYHTSADNLEFIAPQPLADSLMKVIDVLEVLEGDGTYLNLNPKCEPRLGKRGLYSSVGGEGGSREMEMAMLWVLNFTDGHHTLLDIAVRSGYPFRTIKTAADALTRQQLLQELPAAR